MKKRILSLLLTLSLCSVAHAVDLMDVYKDALDNDPLFKGAYDSYMSSTEAIPQARAALYPQVTISGLRGRYVQDSVGFGLVNNLTYASTQWQINASQAVFNYQSWMQVRQAKASVRAALATFNAAAQDLMLRTARAYLDILLARDTLEFAEAKKRANKRQLDQAEQRFKVGLDAITSVYEAKAAYDQSIATVISARNNQINRNENLRKLTNHVYQSLVPLRNAQIPLIHPEPDDVNEWIDIGLRQNYTLYSFKYSMEAAREGIKVQAAGGWPTVTLQGAGSQSLNTVPGNSFFVPERNSTANVELAVNFPVIQGGMVQSRTRQAQYDFQKASERMESAYRDVVVNSRIAFNTIVDGISKVQADRQTVISQRNSLESTEAQFQVGTRTMVDVVNAQQKLFEAQQQLASDQYDLIFAILNLKSLAGTLNVNDLEEVNSWLATTRVHSYFPKKTKTVVAKETKPIVAKKNKRIVTRKLKAAATKPIKSTKSTK